MIWEHGPRYCGRVTQIMEPAGAGWHLSSSAARTAAPAAADRGNPRGRAAPLVDAVLGDLELGPDLLDPDEHLGPQAARSRLGSAALVHQPLHGLLEAVLAQAGAALFQVLADLRVAIDLDLAIEIGVHARQYLGTRHVVGLTAAH